MRAALETLSKQQKNQLLIKFLTVFLGAVGGFSMLFSVVVLAFFMPSQTTNPLNPAGIATEGEAGGGFLSNILEVVGVNSSELPVRTSFLILGVDDEDYGADTIIVGSFNRLTGEIELMSLPRDTHRYLSDETIAFFTEKGRGTGRSTILADLYRRGGRQFGAEAMMIELSSFMGIEFDFYVSMDLGAFRRIVDLVGPVRVNVPMRMFYNDGLGFVIDLQPGYQYLNGQEAEMFVRFRSTARADLQRIENQQVFLQALFEHIMQRETLLANGVGLATTMLSEIQTNATPMDILAYARYLNVLDLDGLTTRTMPTNHNVWIPSLRGGYGRAAETVNEAQLRPIINQMFHGISMELEEVPVELNSGQLAEGLGN